MIRPSPAGAKQSGRGGGIRTPDIQLPKLARYQAALHPAGCAFDELRQGATVTEARMIRSAGASVNGFGGPATRHTRF